MALRRGAPPHFTHMPDMSAFQSARVPLPLVPNPDYHQSMKMHHMHSLPPPPPPSTPESSSALRSAGESTTSLSAQGRRATKSHRPPPTTTRSSAPRTCQPQLIATISAGFDKGDYLIREERGSNLYFDFFEEAYNYACQKGFSRMPKEEEKEYLSIIRRAHRSVPGGCRYNTGRLLMVLRKKLVPIKAPLREDDDDEEEEEEEEPVAQVGDEEASVSYAKGSNGSSGSEYDDRGTTRRKMERKLGKSTNTLPTDSESSSRSTAYSSASTSYVDSWE